MKENPKIILKINLVQDSESSRFYLASSVSEIVQDLFLIFRFFEKKLKNFSPIFQNIFQREKMKKISQKFLKKNLSRIMLPKEIFHVSFITQKVWMKKRRIIQHQTKFEKYQKKRNCLGFQGLEFRILIWFKKFCEKNTKFLP